MKELTIEEKAKRYDDVIRKAKITLDCCTFDSTITEHIVYDIFPELKKSDDERIRKSLIELFKDMEWDDSILHDYNMDKDKTIAWLEKQGEQKSVEWSEYDEHKVKDIIYFLNSAKKHYASTDELDACVRWLWSILQRMG